MDIMLPRILYMGTPDFAVAPLRLLLEKGFPIEAVVTVPDKPAGRGRKLQTSAVKDFALANNLPLFQPENLKDEAFLQTLHGLHFDVGVVVAFRKLPKEVYSLPSLGFFNLHASLLPQYRGAAPIQWAIMNGETESGVTTFLLSDTIDAGAILKQARCPIAQNMTAGELHDALASIGAPLVCDTITELANRSLQPLSQTESEVLQPAPKIFRDTAKIRWEWTAQRIHNHIRGLAPYPGAWTRMRMGENEYEVKLFDSEVAESSYYTQAPVGDVTIPPTRDLFTVSCAESSHLLIRSIQPAGKRRMSVREFLLGCHTDDKIVLL